MPESIGASVVAVNAGAIRIVRPHPVISCRYPKPHCLFHQLHRLFLTMQGIASFHIQAGQIEHRLPMQPLCRLTRQSDDFFVIAVVHGNFRIFHGACFEKPLLRLRIDGRHLVRFDFTNEIGDMWIEEG
ncbi:hypothetical protein CSQ91_11990 [Janthinobacterium sp. BJB301]|nr:hypothetical protein CSQ91_11990 [Janthinobacterium sp. BJB301]